MEELKKQEIIEQGYNDSIALYDEGISLEELYEILKIYEEEEYYLTCAGIKKAIDKVIKDYEFRHLDG